MDLLKFLAALGPYSAPINILLALALRRVLIERDAALADARDLREQRVVDLKEQAIEYREHSEATQAALNRWSEIMQSFLNHRGN